MRGSASSTSAGNYYFDYGNSFLKAVYDKTGVKRASARTVRNDLDGPHLLPVLYGRGQSSGPCLDFGYGPVPLVPPLSRKP